MLKTLIAVSLLALSLSGATGQTSTAAAPPATEQKPITETLHGVEITDPYRWLEDQTSPQTRAWIDAQQKYTQAYLGGLPGRDRLQKRVGELLKHDSIGMIGEYGGYYFLTKRKADEEQAKTYRRKGLQGKDELLLDPYAIGGDNTTSVSVAGLSRDGDLMAYAIRRGGEDEIEIRTMDVAMHKDLPDRLAKARLGGAAIKPDKTGFYYGIDTDKGPRVRYHAMGTPSAKDIEIFGDGYKPGQGIGVNLSVDGRWLILTVYYGAAATKTEVWAQDLSKGTPIFPIVTDVDAQFSGDVAGDTLYLTTTWNAPKKRIIAVDLNRPARDNWRDIVPEGKSPIDGFSLVSGHIFVGTLEDVTSHVREFGPDGKLVREVSLPGLGTASVPSGWWDKPEAFYTYDSFAAPYAIYHYDVPSGKQDVWARVKVPVDTRKFEVKQVFYPSKDGTKIPMFLVYRKGLKLDGNRPTLLYGYGGFQINLTPNFSAAAALWAEHGGVYAVANLRGGGEYGEAWHGAGMLDNKQNVFDDFLGAAEWLTKNGYTSGDKLAIEGGSNGGLLVGAAITQRPDLFRAALCEFPLLDMIRYQKFLVAYYWIPEYGSSDDANQFKTLYAYSPYHRVAKGTKYPAVMFITGDADTRVAPLHARKMAALLQSATGSGSDRPILLHYDTKAGHSGGEPISKIIEDETDSFSFLFAQLGVPY